MRDFFFLFTKYGASSTQDLKTDECKSVGTNRSGSGNGNGCRYGNSWLLLSHCFVSLGAKKTLQWVEPCPWPSRVEAMPAPSEQFSFAAVSVVGRTSFPETYWESPLLLMPEWWTMPKVERRISACVAMSSFASPSHCVCLCLSFFPTFMWRQQRMCKHLMKWRCERASRKFKSDVNLETS